jgi:SNF2 family DNA or RNA helicase
VRVFLTTTRTLGLGTVLPGVDVAVLHDSDWNARADLATLRRARTLGPAAGPAAGPVASPAAAANGALERDAGVPGGADVALPLLRLVARGSCEERLLALADRKRGLHAALKPAPTRCAPARR